MATHRALYLLACLPRTPFLRRAAVDSGHSRRALSQLLEEGLLREPLRGVLVRADAEDDVGLRAAAAALVLPPGAAVCRATAAWLFGIDARRPGTHRDLPPLECAVPIGHSPVRRPEIRCYTTDLRDEDLTTVEGVRCVRPARTAIDLARWSMPGVGLGVLDAMARRNLVQPTELGALVERWNGARYIDQARRLISWCDPRAESPGESCTRLRLLEAGFPPPQLQISLQDELGREVRRLDLGYPNVRYAIEYDGEEFHDAPGAAEADRLRRDEVAHRWGWTILPVRKNLVFGPSMALEFAVGEALGMSPSIGRRTW